MNGNFGGIDKGKLLDMLNSGGNKNLNQALASGDLQKVLASLDPQDAEKVKNVLIDKAALNKILSSPEALALLKKLK